MQKSPKEREESEQVKSNTPKFTLEPKQSSELRQSSSPAGPRATSRPLVQVCGWLSHLNT